jgi:hypothetical protein
VLLVDADTYGGAVAHTNIQGSRKLHPLHHSVRERAIDAPNHTALVIVDYLVNVSHASNGSTA